MHAPLPELSLRRFAGAVAEEVNRPLLLAIGILSRATPRIQDPPHAAWHGVVPLSVELRFVISSRKLVGDRRFVAVVDCPSEGPTRRFLGQACFCMAARWFRRALVLFPLARFVGKLEDDASVHVARLLAELTWSLSLPVPRASATSSESRDLPTPRASTSTSEALLWFGHFQWAAHDGQRGAFCGGEEQLPARRSSAHQWCKPFWPSNNTLIAPFASGALDVRSRSLVQRFTACDYVWEYLAAWQTEQSRGLSCDGGMGHFIALCVREPITALHLPTAKFQRVAADRAAGKHCTVVHPNKEHVHVRWPHGRATQPAMLPIPLTIHPPTGLGTHATWTASNESLVRAYQSYTQRGLGDRLCDVVPCA